jgi:hypothetical protein
VHLTAKNGALEEDADCNYRAGDALRSLAFRILQSFAIRMRPRLHRLGRMDATDRPHACCRHRHRYRRRHRRSHELPPASSSSCAVRCSCCLSSSFSSGPIHCHAQPGGYLGACCSALFRRRALRRRVFVHSVCGSSSSCAASRCSIAGCAPHCPAPGRDQRGGDHLVRQVQHDARRPPHHGGARRHALRHGPWRRRLRHARRHRR